MALIVESGVGVPGANSLVALAEADATLTARGHDVPTESQLIAAMDALAVLNYRGDKLTADQGLPFPRVDMLHNDGSAMDAGNALAVMKVAQAWMAHYVSQGFDVMAVAKPAVRREKVDVIERELAVTVGDTTAITVFDLPMVSALISPLIRGDVDSLHGADSSNMMLQGRAYRA